MIGDSLVDIEFARRLGMTAILIDANQAHPKPGDQSAKELADLRFPSLQEAVNTLLEKG
jgi:FMN phosphatase YigB (HAD superfamily)